MTEKERAKAAEEHYARMRKQLDERLNADKRLTAIADKIKAKTADFRDTAEYSELVSNHISAVIQENIGNISFPLGKQYVCEALLKDHYTAINDVIGNVQISIDERNGIHIAPQKAPYPAERVTQVAHALEDTTVVFDTIKRRAGAPVANVAKSFHDDYMKENAKFRSDAGLKCFINRTTDGKCCEWCSALAGRYVYGEHPEDIFRRHDNCGCSTIFENGRQRQDVWSKKSWEAPAVTQRETTPTRLLTEQAREIQGRNLRFRGIESESSKLKTDNPNSIVNLKNINSSSYRRLFEQIDDNPHTSRTIFQNAKNILTHRNGTEYEDLVFINSLTGEIRSRTDFNVPKNVMPSKSMMKMLNDCESNTIIAIHNHPNSAVPSISDINAARDRKYKYGIIACHNGNLYKYTVLKEYDESFVDLALDSINSVLYNKEKLGDKFKEQLEHGLKLLRGYGVDMEVLQ